MLYRFLKTIKTQSGSVWKRALCFCILLVGLSNFDFSLIISKSSFFPRIKVGSHYIKKEHRFDKDSLVKKLKLILLFGSVEVLNHC